MAHCAEPTTSQGKETPVVQAELKKLLKEQCFSCQLRLRRRKETRSSHTE